VVGLLIVVAGVITCSRIGGIFALIGSIVGMLTGLVVGANEHGFWEATCSRAPGLPARDSMV